MYHAILLFLQIPLIGGFILPSTAPESRRLVAEQETTVELTKGEEQRFTIQLSHSSEPLFMYITPCGAAVHWSLYSVKNHGSSQDLSSIRSISESSDVELIAGEQDDRRMKFFSNKLTSDTLLLVLTSPGTTSAEIFIAHTQESMDERYPPLPHDVRLAHAVTSIENSDLNQALVTWKVAEAVRNADEGRYRICTIVSRRFPHWAVCDHVEEGLESVHCVPQNNNSIVINKLRSGKKYYMTVFVRDSIHGTTSSYDTLEVNLRKSTPIVGNEAKKESSRPLLDAALQAGSLPAQKNSFINYHFQMPANSIKGNRVLLIVHACNGYVRMTVYRNGKMLRKSEPFTGFRRFLVTNVRSGQLRFQVSNDDSREKSIRMWASTRPKKSPYPLLPEDTSVKVVRRTCSTATLQWLRSGDDHAKYCIYKRRENANFLEELVSRVDNLCEGGLASSELVGCYTHRGPRENAVTEDIIGVIESTVNGLDASSTYRFDLLATPLNRQSAQSLPYRTVWVRTANSC